MLAVLLATVSCVASNLLIRYAAEHYTYNVAFILLMIECVKLLICAANTYKLYLIFLFSRLVVYHGLSTHQL